MSGPPRTPTEILKLRGSWLAKSRPGEPQPEKTAPPMPAGLSEREAAVWDRLVATLEEMQVVTVADWPELERYARQWCRWEDCEAVIRASGMTYEVEGRNGRQIKERPEVREAARLDASLRAIEQQFGLTPASRSRLSILPTSRGIASKNDFLESLSLSMAPRPPENSEAEDDGNGEDESKATGAQEESA